MMTPGSRLLLATLCLSFLRPVHAQQAAQPSAQQPPARLAFEVAVVRPAKPGQAGGFIKPLANGGGYTAHNMNLKVMMGLMYEVPLRQIQGGPDWLSSELFDVEAKADGSYSREDLHEMFRHLLEDRFGLKMHKDVKQGPVYLLTVDPAGLKMKVNTSPQDFEIPMNGGPNHVVGKRVSLAYLSWWLGQVLQADERPVVDGTGLTGFYDFTLAFRPELPPGSPADALPPELQDLPSIFAAVKDQLGLKLQAQKGPVTDYVIDSLHQPTEN